MTAPRYSLKLALASLRAARTTSARAAVRYGREDDIRLLLGVVRTHINRAEHALLRALRLARARVVVKRRRAA